MPSKLPNQYIYSNYSTWIDKKSFKMMSLIFSCWIWTFFSSNLDDMEPFYQIELLKDCATLAQLKSYKNLIEFFGICKSNHWLYLIFEEPQQSLKKLLVSSRTTRATHPTSVTTLSELFVLKTLYELSSAMEFINNQQVNLF